MDCVGFFVFMLALKYTSVVEVDILSEIDTVGEIVGVRVDGLIVGDFAANNTQIINACDLGSFS